MTNALLFGVQSALLSGLSLSTEHLGIRPGGNGAPKAAYKGGQWYYGIYFSGKTFTNPESTDFDVTCSVGVDVTYVASQTPTAKRGEWISNDQGLYRECDRVFQLMLKADSVVAQACNQALQEHYNIAASPNCCFYEDFNVGTMSGDRYESAEWIAAEMEKNPTILVVSMNFSGLRYHQSCEGTPL